MNDRHFERFKRTILVGAIALAACGGTVLGQTAGGAEAQPTPSARQTNAPSAHLTPEIVVTASRAPRDIQSEPSVTYRLNASDATSREARRTTAGILEGLPSVMGQKTSYAQTSPYLRGFTGYHTLCLIDGVRLNNSVFRSGPNQYWNTLDPLSVDHYELVMGPGSVLYGSDAIGGVLNAWTDDPPDWDGDAAWMRRLHCRGSTAERSSVGRIQFGGRPTEEFGFTGGISLKSFGDLEGGQDVGRQSHTGYDEQDFDVKARWKVGDNATISVAHQSVRQEDAWRTHRTVYGIDWEGLSRGTDKVNSYDQSRDLTYFRFRAENPDGLARGIEATVSRHAQSEDLDRVKKDDLSERQGFDVVTWGSTIQIESPSAIGQWVYGMDFYHDIVDSYARKFEADGRLAKAELQGPVADEATYDMAGVFVHDTISCFDGKLDLIPGARYTYAAADADKVKDPLTGDATSLDDKWQAVAGSLRMLVPLTKDRSHALHAGIAQGFRAPNLSDLTRFDIARSTEIEIPSPDLDPERFVTYEAGVRSRVARLTSQISYYYTTMDDTIIRTPTGRTTDGLIEVVKRNSGSGYVQGVEICETCRFTPAWSAWIAASWQDGELDAYPTSSADEATRQYISRLMPAAAQVGVRWQAEESKCWAEIVGNFADDADKLSADDRLDTQRIPPGGTPGYAVCTVRAGTRVGKALDLALGIENLLDEDYRIHGSGVNEPGRNLVLTADCRF